MLSRRYVRKSFRLFWNLILNLSPSRLSIFIKQINHPTFINANEGQNLKPTCTYKLAIGQRKYYFMYTSENFWSSRNYNICMEFTLWKFQNQCIYFEKYCWQTTTEFYFNKSKIIINFPELVREKDIFPHYFECKKWLFLTWFWRFWTCILWGKLNSWENDFFGKIRAFWNFNRKFLNLSL